MTGLPTSVAGAGFEAGSSAHDKACSVVPRLSDAETDPASVATYARDTYAELGAFSATDRDVVLALGQVAAATEQAARIQVPPGQSWASTPLGGRVNERLDGASAELRDLCGDGA